MRDRRAGLAVALALAGTGCNLAPAYERPASPVAGAFAEGAGSGLAAADSAGARCSAILGCRR